MADEYDEAPETPFEELLQRVADRLDEHRDYVDWVADQVDGSLRRVVRAVLADDRVRCTIPLD